MNSISTYNDDLLIRYFCGEAGEKDMEELALWIKEDSRNKDLFEEYARTWRKIDQKTVDEIDVLQEWKRVEHEIINKNFRRPVYLQILRIAAIFLLVAVPTAILLFYLTKPEQQAFVASDGIVEKNLADGTTVILNTGAVLKISSFGDKNRNVNFAGEAYFNVAHDGKKPFIISKDDIRISVVGTSFYLNTAGRYGETEVILDSGIVILYLKDKPSQKVILKPGEKAVIISGKISKKHNTEKNYMAWKTHKFIFENDPLSVIVDQVNKVYKTKIILEDPALAACLVTATFDGQSPASILNVLKATLNLDIASKENSFNITGKGCKSLN